MNYRHAFHAGNFADLMKHAILTRLLASLTAAAAPLTVIDTHAGAGLYDLEGLEAVRTGEGRAGIGTLMARADAPEVFDALKAVVRRANAAGACRFYPGSPVLIAEALRPRDRYIACELRADDVALLKAALPRQAGTEVLKADGWAVVAARSPKGPAALLVLIDPPFERGDDYHQVAAAHRQVLAVNPGAVIATWAPIKDLASFDAFLGALEDSAAGCPLLVAELRLRPLTDPMAMNGCALVVVNPPSMTRNHAAATVSWLASNLGEQGAKGCVTVVGGGA